MFAKVFFAARRALAVSVCFVCLLAAVRADASTRIALGAYAEYDLTRVASDGDSVRDSSLWRRLRINIKGRFDARLSYAVERDFADERWKDMMVRLDTANGAWHAGQFNQPFGLWALDTVRRTPFAESTAFSLTAPDRRLGVMWQRLQASHTLSVSGYGKDVHGVGPDWAVGARATYVHESDFGRVHLGLAAAHERGWGRLGFSLRPEVNAGSGRFAGSGALAADRLDRWGLEAAWQRGRWMAQGEWLGLRLDGDAPGEVERDLRTGYLMLHWTPFGPPRRYTEGVFSSTSGEGPIGPLEIALRFGSAELPLTTGDDAEQRTWSLGAVLWLSRRVRIQTAYVHGRSDEGRKADIWQTRVQVQY